ncbi:MAG: FkbM family methyltransferase [Rhizomicrobium sp.]
MKPRRIHPGRATRLLDRFPIPLISKLAPGLLVDVGAASGEKMRAMLDANPASRVIAYEPFAGNLVYLDAIAAREPRLTVRPVAVSDRAGTGTLDVPSVVAADNQPPGHRRGASVLGRLVPHGAPAGMGHETPVVRLDDEIAEPVRFLKLDIQGGERAALNGARRLIESKGVDFIFVEFNGDLRVLRFLEAHGYVVFDGVYLAWPSRRALRGLFGGGVPGRWHRVDSIALSTGAAAARVWPQVPFRSFALYCAWFAFTRLFVCGLQTDLLCVHRTQLAEFSRINIAALRESKALKTGRPAAVPAQ